MKIIVGVPAAGEVFGLLHCSPWTPFWPLGRDLLQSLPSACAGSALVRRCLVQSNLSCYGGDVATLASTLQLFVGFVQLFVWEVFGPSLWIPFSSSCSLLLAVYVIILQLIFLQVFVSYTVLRPFQWQELILVSVLQSKSWCSLGDPRRMPASMTFVYFQWERSSEKKLFNSVTNSILKKTLNSYVFLDAFPLLISFYCVLFLTIMRKTSKN